jgi:hypothetical protein
MCFVNSQMEGCSRDVEGSEEDSMKALREGISLSMNSWWLIRVRASLGYYGHQPELRLNSLYDRLFSCFFPSKDLPSAKIAVKAQLTSFLPHPPCDNSLQQVCDQLVTMYQECLEGDFSSIQIIKEANSRRLMWKQANNNFELEKDPFKEKMKQARLTAHDRFCADMLFAAKIAYLKKKKKFKKANLLIRKKKKMASKFEMETPSVEFTHKPNISMQKQVTTLLYNINNPT